jgi:hypothetical protein
MLRSVIIGLNIVGLLLSCSPPNRLETLESKLDQAIPHESGKTLTITADMLTTDFDWDEIILLEPYVRLEHVENDTGYRLSCISKAIQSYDNIYTIGFFLEGKCLGYVELDRNRIAFIEPSFKQSYVLVKRNELQLVFKSS